MFKSAGLALICLSLWSSAAMATCTWTILHNTYTADADQVMNNFDCLAPLDSPSFTGSLSLTSTSDPVLTLYNPDTSLYAASILALAGPSSGGTAAQTRLMHINVNSGGTQSRFTVSQWNSAGAYVADLLQYDYTTQQWNFTTGGPIQFSIASSGNVGVGVMNPVLRFEVVSGANDLNSNGGIKIDASDYSTNHGYLILNKNSGSGTYATIQSGDVTAYQPLAINPNGGNVGIGTTSPSYALDVNGTIRGTNVSPSDGRLKRDIEPLRQNALAIISKLKPVTFLWKNLSDDGMRGRQTGFIAQDVKAVLPDTVLTANDKQHTLGLKYNEFIPILTKALQEQQAEIAALKVVNDHQAQELRHMLGQVSALQRKLDMRTASR